MERKAEEFCQGRVGNALQRLQELQPGECISFVGQRMLAEELILEAERMGLRIQADLKEDFNEHLLTVLGKMEIELVPSPEVNSFISWVRVTFVSLMRVFKRSLL